VPFRGTLFSKFNYVIPLFLIPAVATFGTGIAPNKPVLLGRDWGIIAAFSLASIAFLLWLPFKRVQHPWSKVQLWFFSLLVVAWIFQSVSTHLDGRVFNSSAILLPIAAVLIVAKRPGSESLKNAFVCFLYGLAIISVASLILGSSGFIPNGFDGPDSGVSRLPILNSLFGIDTRWAGPFGSVNIAAPIGALLLVAGFTLKGINRVVIAAGGLGILVLSQGRTSLFAALFALAVLFAYSRQVQSSKYATQMSIASGGFMIGVLAIYIAVFDPTMAGRTPIWRNFLDLFIQDPLFGIGTSGLEGILSTGLSGYDVILFSHGHNVLLDIAVRHGIFLLVLSIAILTITALVAWRTRKLDSGKSLALAVFLIVVGLAETIHSWQYLSVYVIVMIYIVVKANPSVLLGTQSSENVSLNQIQMEKND
jgi:O-antigen ligase